MGVQLDMGWNMCLKILGKMNKGSYPYLVSKNLSNHERGEMLLFF